ncbi:solute carrier family 41 member 1 [Cephus cinctus]|uniref:Solute carrier family 41 member 1 n=1 Tax=Cephus cinctus TaxID=211228 RepID=A0AAJ7W7F2_CEPCN|nr:solute carrier family 41 member 1 [Cephus cinctus]XP_015608467.1 solute carrier family 41 member 1 [Cephus cinctus]XP_015608468.1 solute carrier family 41 member 1 [Cephus cinctus]XP_015608469.1 solute carrier family 41 member 1 [Cephus cinctus]XP_024947191.1 solute carrier family 41 member 1 [Cephus cinctus]XP_024947192.1 solute carrier family 41 member 1 [Cephus cinctus]XP_024947193.1 solute carrier family 41 member 1 [Cephus cinctus]XP_024947194.1 solute carrier family 41 member 1 [Cep
MSHAEFRQSDSWGNSRIRHRKYGSASLANGSGEMVGSGSEEVFGRNLQDITTELDIDSDDENIDEDTRRLIPSVESNASIQGINNNSKKIIDQNQTEDKRDENVWSITIQMFIPFLLAGFGMVAASLLLDVVQHWSVYRVVSEVYILVPALLGLKGNLEMTLASRLSTQANLGHMDTKNQQWTLIVGNLALIQCQAMVVGMLASLAAVILGWVPEAHFDIHHGLLLCASALLTASVASFLLGLVMVAVILLSRRMNINPDNVATPIAASLGDLTTLALLSWIASLLYNAIDHSPWISPMIIIFCVLATPFWGYIAARNPFTKEVLDYGWTPVISAMLISSIGGLILDYTISSYKGIAVFQLVINGVGGNLVAVQASRISTSLHKERRLGFEESPTICISPFHAFLAPGGHSRTARVLLLMVIPGHLIFNYTISYLQAGHTSFTPIFITIYLTAALLQVVLLLYIAQLMVVWMWSRGMDPDSSAIPYLTAAGDLLGTALLGIAFHILYAIGDGDSDVGD